MRREVVCGILLSAVFMLSGNMVAQHTVQVEGYVKDSITDEALPDVTVALRGTTKGTATDKNGYFSIKAASDSMTLSVSYIGYETSLVTLEKDVSSVNIRLKPAMYELREVTVRSGKEKYSKRDNPAVAFARHVIARRDLNDPYEHDYFSYHTYEQRTFANNGFDAEKVRRNGLSGQFGFLSGYADSTSVKGKTLLPLYNEEIIEDCFYRKSPRTERKVVKGAKRAGIIEILPEDGVKQFIEEAFRDVDIFRDNVPLFLNRFVSPLSSIGPDYYRYYLLDTVPVDGERCMDLGFVPFNPESFGFVGHLYVTLDSTYFVKKVNLHVPGDINLNFVSEMSIDQEYIRTDDGTRILTKNDISLLFKLTKKMKGAYARRIALYRNHSFEKPPDMTVFEEKAPVLESENAHRRTEKFWTEARESAGEIQQASVEKMMAQLREVPLFYRTEKVMNILINGYVPTSATNSLFDLGPVNTLVSGNALEGTRFRLGGTTTVRFNRRFFMDGYLAYGLKDHKFKGDALFEYSFNEKKNFRKEYPFHYIRAEYRYDIN
ncbi:MAG: carboxypeptidase-like regulatory domain-containing protein, partial [Tannerella sp.]|nr:carboxypeptidase-like regulatory domain-containing protein [Tannerella sp.]